MHFKEDSMEEKLNCPVEIACDKRRTPLFEEDTVYDFETVYFIQKYTTVFMRKKTIITAAVALIYSVITLVMKYYLAALIGAYVFLAALYPILSAKKTARQYMKNMSDSEKHHLYSFYDDHFTVRTDIGASYYEYSAVSKICTSDDKILIYLPDGSAYCVISQDKSLHEFLKNKQIKGEN